jgi:sugar phosphate isomerase/epimerase
MRLGGPVFQPFTDPDGWLVALRQAGYGAAYCPVNPDANQADIQAYATAAQKANIIMAEVGAWSNPLSPDDQERRAALAKCQAGLALADEIGARCCVNIAGSRGQPWDGHHPDNLTAATFDLIVESVRAIIDAVQPRRTFYTLEPMPWMYPDSADSYLALIKAINRDRFAVHLDLVNLIGSPQRYYGQADFIRDCFAKLGPYIKSCHAKDIILAQKLTVHLDEVRPGLGQFDYSTFLRELNQLDPDTPLMLEHLPTVAEYTQAAAHIRAVAQTLNLTFL